MAAAMQQYHHGRSGKWARMMAESCVTGPDRTINMNLIDVALMLFGNEKSAPAHRQWVPEPVLPVCGQICQASVVAVKDRVAILRTGNVELLVFIGELSDRRIETASEVLALGQIVEAVILEENSRRPGEWIASLKAVSEARRREQLSTFFKGDRHPARVCGFTSKGALVRIEEVEFFVPNADIAWRPIDAPSQVLKIGQDVDVEILDVFVPAWTAKWKAGRTKAIASIRACIERPTAKFVPMAFDAVPFRIRVNVSRPAFLDPVLMHVLEELAHGRCAEQISQRTRLPPSTLDAMFSLLAREGLLQKGSLSTRAISLVEASDIARTINEERLGALYMPMAEPGSRMAKRDGHVLNPPIRFPHPIPPYPTTWPRPVSHRPRENTFLHSNGEDIPSEVMTWCLGKERGETLLAHHSDQRLRLRLMHDPEEKARQPICTFVRDHWLFGALWSRFDAVGENKPYRPEDKEDTAPVLLLIKLSAWAGDERLSQPIYLEPYTSTFWMPRFREWRGGRRRSEQAFPSIPPVGEHGWTLRDGKQVSRLVTEQWELVSFESGK
jgi:predicted RNA-binding protein with RPS1 domain